MSMSVPMLASPPAIGALNLYTRAPGSLPDAHHDRASQFAAQAADAVALAVRLAELEDKTRHLETALRSRSTIDQAIGIVMAQTRLGAEHAFEVLRARSQTTDKKLRDIAARSSPNSPIHTLIAVAVDTPAESQYAHVPYFCGFSEAADPAVG